MAGRRKLERAPVATQACGGQRKVHFGASQVLKSESVEMFENKREIGPTLHQTNSFGVESISDKRRANTVPRDVAEQQREIVFARGNHAVISSDRSRSLIVRLDGSGGPSEAPGSETLLYVRRKEQVFFRGALARFEQCICPPQIHLRTLLLGNIGEGHDRKDASVGILELLRGDDNRQAVSGDVWQIEFISIPALSSSHADLVKQPGNIFKREQVRNILAYELIVVPANHFPEHCIGIHNAWTLVRNDDALI